MESFHTAMLALLVLAALEPWLGRYVTGPASAPPQPAAPAAGRSVAALMGKGDNFLLLRLIAASIVIYAHSYALSPRGSHGDDLTHWLGIYSGSVAVYMFFFISGFLVTGSWLRQQSLRGFLVARVVRIVPAYAACLVGGALLVGTIAGSRPLAVHLSDPQTWSYIYWNLSFPEMFQFSIPGVFEQHRRTAVNGSLWTLPAEVRAYALLAVFGVLGLLDRLPRLLLALAIGFWLVVFERFRVPTVTVADTLPMLGYFSLGMVAWRARDWLRLDSRIALVLVLVAVLARGSSAYPYLFSLALCYGILWLAYVPRALLGFNRFGDYSYGVYLWGFPIQQLLVHWIASPTPTLLTLLAWPLSLACAVLSWHAIERPALRLRLRRAPSPQPETQAT